MKYTVVAYQDRTGAGAEIVRFPDGTRWWLCDGVVHRLDGPAVVSTYEGWEWRVNGVRVWDDELVLRQLFEEGPAAAADLARLLSLCVEIGATSGEGWALLSALDGLEAGREGATGTGSTS